MNANRGSCKYFSPSANSVWREKSQMPMCLFCSTTTTTRYLENILEEILSQAAAAWLAMAGSGNSLSLCLRRTPARIDFSVP